MAKHNTAAALADKITLHQVDLMRLEESVRKGASKLFRRLEKDLITVLEKVDPTSPQADTFKIRRVEKLLEQTQATSRTAFKKYNDDLKSDLRGVSRLEARAVGAELNTTLGAEVATVALPASAVSSIVNTSLVRGSVVSDWIRRQSRAFGVRLETEIKIGSLAGEGIPDLVRRIRGTQVPGAPRGTFIGGIMQTTTREATAIARTSIQTIANTTRLEAYKQNQDIIKGVQALVTLDLRTSAICISRSGGAWNIKTGAPLPDSATQIKFPGPPPWHWNCRTTLIPVTKSWDELGGKIRAELPESTQSSMDGRVSGDLTYEEWLKKQSKARRIEVLGVRKEELWRKGKIKNLRQLVDQTGRPLTIVEIEAKRARRSTVLSVLEDPDSRRKAAARARWDRQLREREKKVATTDTTATTAEDKRLLQRIAVKRQAFLQKKKAAGAVVGTTKKRPTRARKKRVSTATTEEKRLLRKEKPAAKRRRPRTPKPPKVENDLSNAGQIRKTLKSKIQGSAKTNVALNTAIDTFSDRAAAAGMTTARLGPKMKNFTIEVYDVAAHKKRYPSLTESTWTDGRTRGFYDFVRNRLVIPAASDVNLSKQPAEYARVFAHEFGHHLDFTVLKKVKAVKGLRRSMGLEYTSSLKRLNKKLGTDLSGADIFRNSDSLGVRSMRDTAKGAVSTYSFVSKEEWVAEGFARFFGSDAQRKTLAAVAPKTNAALTRFVTGK